MHGTAAPPDRPFDSALCPPLARAVGSSPCPSSAACSWDWGWSWPARWAGRDAWSHAAGRTCAAALPPLASGGASLSLRPFPADVNTRAPPSLCGLLLSAGPAAGPFPLAPPPPTTKPTNPRPTSAAPRRLQGWQQAWFADGKAAPARQWWGPEGLFLALCALAFILLTVYPREVCCRVRYVCCAVLLRAVCVLWRRSVAVAR